MSFRARLLAETTLDQRRVLATRGEIRQVLLFGRAAANLMDTVALKLKHGDRVPEELRPENHSPLM